MPDLKHAQFHTPYTTTRGILKNAHVERYKHTVRYEWLAHHLSDSLYEIQDFATDLVWTYNHDQTNMVNGGITQK